MAAKNKKEKKILKNNKKSLFHNALLLKQTLISTWKNKLQLVILLLLAAFATSLITGTWISYQRMIAGSEELGLNDLNFDSVLTYSPETQGITQITEQAFSLTLGKIFYNNPNGEIKALYFDNTIIGQQLKAITNSDIHVEYNRDATNKISGLKILNWANASEPLDFDVNNQQVAGSIYGQLILKANATADINLKEHYLNAANDLYQELFVNKTAIDIMNSITTFFTAWIGKNSADPNLSDTDEQFTTWFLNNKINYQRDDLTVDKRIPNLVNAEQANTPGSDILAKIVTSTEEDPRLAATLGLNGQWMRINRNFAQTADPNVYANFLTGYSSPYNFNKITDGDEPNNYSWDFMKAAAALQKHDFHIRNQFNASAGNIKGNHIDVKVVDIGLPNADNKTNLKVFEGVMPTAKNEIVITPQYARREGYRPGDQITINNVDFIITGLGGDAFDIYPTVNDLDPIPNTRSGFIAYVTPDAWNNNSWYLPADKQDNTIAYFSPWTNVGNTSSFDTDLFNDYFQKTIFSNSGGKDLNQSNYNEYLVKKYVDKQQDAQTTYTIVPNMVIKDGDPQFSLYSGRKSIFNSSVLGFMYVAIAGVIFLVLIVIFITTLIVKKAIQQGQVSMGILKSIGYKTWQIAFSYLAYPIITLVIAIPIGWFVGLAVQVYLTEIFNTLFVLPYNVFNFNIVPLFIAIAVIIGFITITTIGTAFRMLKKDPLFLIKKDSDLVLGMSSKPSRITAMLKNNFRLRFLWSLTKTSWKKILVTSGVISLATLSIVATTAIPATINSLKGIYFKSQKYNNYYKYATPMPNMPLSKYGLYSWDYFNKPANELYYPIYGAMPWPEKKIIYNRTGTELGWYNPLKYNPAAPNIQDITTFLDNVSQPDKTAALAYLATNLAGSSSGALSIDDLVWSYSWLGGKGFSNQLITDLSTQDLTPGRNFSTSLISFASGALPSILGVPNPGGATGEDAISEILKQVLPGYIRQSLAKYQDSYAYFSIGHNTVAFNPAIDKEKGIPSEELVTQFQAATYTSKLQKKGLMDIIGVNPDTKMLVLSNDEINNMKYNASATEIPMVINQAFKAQYNLQVGETFDAAPNINTLYYLNNVGKYVPFPKDSWYYGTNPTVGDSGGVWSKSGTKWSYRGSQPINNGATADYYDQSGFNYNGMYDKNGVPIINSQPQSWSDMNNVWLKLPADISPSAKTGTIRDSKGVTNLPLRMDQIEDTTDHSWIRPFSYKVTTQGDNLQPLDILLNRPPEWYMGMVDKGVMIKKSPLSNDNLNGQLKNDMPVWWQQIVGNNNPIHKYHIIGVQNSYDSPHAYVDQTWANQIVGYNAFNNKTTYGDTDVDQWFSGKLSAANDIYDLIGRMSFKADMDDYTVYGADSLHGNKNILLVNGSELLSQKQEMLSKMSDIAFSAGALFIVTTIICSILIVIMITDLFTDQFRRFMAHMKAEGYTNWEINSFTLGIFTPWALLGYIVGFALGFLLVFVLLKLIALITASALPFIITWWILPASFALIASIYVSTFIINNSELNKMNLIELLKSDE